MKCLRCEEEMFTAKMCGDVSGMGVYLSNKKKGILETEKRSSVICYVCPSCGHIELIAKEVQNLKLD